MTGRIALTLGRCGVDGSQLRKVADGQVFDLEVVQ